MTTLIIEGFLMVIRRWSFSELEVGCLIDFNIFNLICDFGDLSILFILK